MEPVVRTPSTGIAVGTSRQVKDGIPGVRSKTVSIALPSIRAGHSSRASERVILPSQLLDESAVSCQGWAERSDGLEGAAVGVVGMAMG
jgi:hypothetical protein